MGGNIIKAMICQLLFITTKSPPREAKQMYSFVQIIQELSVFTGNYPRVGRIVQKGEI